MAAAPSASSRWLFGPAPDLLLGCGALYGLAMVVFSLAGPSIRAHQADWVVPYLILLLSMPHYGATLVRVYEQRVDRRSYVLFSLWATLLIVGAFVAGVYDARVASWLFTIYITWSPWHYTGQNYGIAVLFLRRRGVAVSPAAKRALHVSFVLSYALTFLVFHGSFGSLVYSPDAAGDGLAFLSLGIPVALTRVLFPATLLGYAAALAVAGVWLWRAASSPRDLLPTALVALTQALWFSIPFSLRFFELRVGVEPLDSQHLVRDYVFFVALGHATQYLWVTTYYARASARWTGYGRYLGKTLASGAAVWTLPVVLFAPDALGRTEYGAGLALLIAAVVNIHHFILDGAIWKLRQHRIASVLIRAVAADADAEPAGPGGAWLRRGAWGLAAAGLAVSLFVSWATYFGFPSARASGDFASANGLLDALARVGRDSSRLRLSLGVSLERSGDLDSALRQYVRASELAPGYRPHVAAGRALARQQRYAEAAREFETASALAPTSHAIPISASTAWVRAGDPARARSLLEAALARLPGSAALHDALGRLAQHQGDTSEAVAQYREALRGDPRRLGTANDLAWILATSDDPELRDPEESIRLARYLLEQVPSPDPNLLDTLAAGLAAAGRFDEAVEVATLAESLAATRGGAALRGEISRRLELYRAGRPYVSDGAPQGS